jgi:hypothetical protein
MNLPDIIITIGLALLVVGAYAGLITARSWIKQSKDALEESRFGWLIEHLVQAAEEQIKGRGQGEAKLQWVLTQLDERVPGFDEELANTIIRSAVHRIHQQGQWLTVPGELTEGRGDQILGR